MMRPIYVHTPYLFRKVTTLTAMESVPTSLPYQGELHDLTVIQCKTINSNGVTLFLSCDFGIPATSDIGRSLCLCDVRDGRKCLLDHEDYQTLLTGPAFEQSFRLSGYLSLLYNCPWLGHSNYNLPRGLVLYDTYIL